MFTRPCNNHISLHAHFNATHAFARKSNFVRFLVSLALGGFTLSKKTFSKEKLGVDVAKDVSDQGVDADACPDGTKSHLRTHLKSAGGWKGYGPIISRRLVDVRGVMVGKVFSLAGAGAFEGPCTFSFSSLHSKLVKYKLCKQYPDLEVVQNSKQRAK